MLDYADSLQFFTDIVAQPFRHQCRVQVHTMTAKYLSALASILAHSG